MERALIGGRLIAHGSGLEYTPVYFIPFGEGL